MMNMIRRFFKRRECMPAYLETYDVLDFLTSEVKSKIKGVCLDFPRSGDIVSEDSLFSGWLLKSDLLQKVHVVICSEGRRYELGLDVDRPDVLNSVMKIDKGEALYDFMLGCGFCERLNVNLNCVVRIYVSVDGVEYLWKEIYKKSDCVDLSGISSIWKSLPEGGKTKLDLNNIKKIVSRLGVKVVVGFLFKDISVVNAGYELNSESTCEVKDFISDLKSDSFIYGCVLSAISSGVIKIKSPVGGVAVCNSSFSTRSRINVLLFTSSNGADFYIFQHVGSADAVYVPELSKVYFMNGHLNVGLIKGCMEEVLSNSGCFFAGSSRKNVFLGLIVSHFRPYHFYYDIAPAVNDLYSAGLLSKAPALYYYEGSDFCSFRGVYDIPSEEYLVSPEKLLDITLNKSGFCFHVGELYRESRYQATLKFDEVLVGYSRRVFQVGEEYNELLKCYPVIWFGVTVDKRSWLEQEEAAVSIFNKLSDKYPNLALIFDGWTSPIHRCDTDEVQTKNDNEVVSRISRRLNSNIKVCSVVGLNSVEKIAYGRLVDFAVSNFLTGGLHVSRFCNKPGVGHISKKMYGAGGGHIHNRTLLVDVENVVDEAGSEELRGDFVSYSIDWLVIYEMLLDMIEGRVKI